MDMTSTNTISPSKLIDIIEGLGWHEREWFWRELQRRASQDLFMADFQEQTYRDGYEQGKRDKEDELLTKRATGQWA